MASIKVVLKEAQPKKDGTFPILIRIIAHRKVKNLSTGYSVKQNQFKEGQDNWVVRHTDARLINAAIERKRSALAEKIYMAEIEGADIDTNLLTGNKKKLSFISLLKEQREIYEKRNQVSAYNKLGIRIKNLSAAWEKDVAVSEINKYWVDKYINARYQKDASPNTIRKDLSAFSGVLLSSEYFSGKNYFKEAQKKIPKVPINKEKLTAEEIKVLESVRLYNLEDVARDIFLFSFYTFGMRVASVLTFRREYIKKNKITYQMNKGKKFIEVDPHPKLQAIIDKYRKNKTPFLFPVLKEDIADVWEMARAVDIAESLMRTRLKRVAVICGIDKNITMHIARHTFAYLALQKGASYPVLKDALGHSDYATTQAYLNGLSSDAVNKAVKGVYE